jgi:FeS assembly SUF system regulator
MIRLTRQTDYGFVLLTRMAGDRPQTSHNSRELSAETRLPAPMVSKILKALVRAGVLVSQRGVKGGYHLARPAEETSVAAIINALEGPIAMTECSPGTGACAHESFCAVRTNWQLINQAVTIALESLTLADMAHPMKREILLTPRRRAPLGAPAASAETT